MPPSSTSSSVTGTTRAGRSPAAPATTSATWAWAPRPTRTTVRGNTAGAGAGRLGRPAATVLDHHQGRVEDGPGGHVDHQGLGEHGVVQPDQGVTPGDHPAEHILDPSRRASAPAPATPVTVTPAGSPAPSKETGTPLWTHHQGGAGRERPPAPVWPGQRPGRPRARQGR